jgi:1-acyl-sn-glycerol-3-phosphate acyltransferase
MKRITDGIRSIIFTVSFYVLTAIMLSLSVPVLVLSRRYKRAVSMFWFNMIYRAEKYVMNLNYRVIGRENLPPAPFIIASKHQSAWETLKVYHIFGEDTAIVAKKELLDIPIWGQYGLAMGLVPVDRSKGREAMNDMVIAAREAVTNGRNILVFPQGTRVPVGMKMPYKGGIVKLYEGLNVPVVPVAINAGLFWPKKSFWKKSGVITVEILPPIEAGLPTEIFFDKMVDVIETASDRLCALPVEHASS